MLSRSLSIPLTLSLACGGAGDGAGSPDAGGPDAASDCDDCPTAWRHTAFVFDQRAHQILRMHDASGDGDMMDPGEVTVFFDNSGPLGIYNSMGMVALGPGELLAADNVAGEHNDDSNIVHLVDENGDGDALDPGEATLWWNGALPGGGALTFPVALAVGADGALYAVQNDAFDDQPDAIYRLSDDNGDGDADDAGEAMLHVDLTDEVTPQVLDLVFDAAGAAYAIDIRNPEDPNNASLDRIAADGSSRAEMLDAVALYTLTQTDEELIMPGAAVSELTYDPVRDEIVFSTIDRYASQPEHLVAVRDADGSGRIDSRSELRVVFDEQVANLDRHGKFRDLVWLPDGSLLGPDAFSGRVLRLVDQDGDGAFLGAGEVSVVYDAAQAAAAGLHAAENLFTTAVHSEEVAAP